MFGYHLFSISRKCCWNLDHCFLSDYGLRIWVLQRLQRIIWQAVPANFPEHCWNGRSRADFSFWMRLPGVDICECMNRCYENMELLEIQGKEKKNFFISYVDVPGKDEEITVEHVVEQLRRKVLEPLHERYGTDISDAAMRKAVEKHNEICRIISEMGEMRKSRKIR